MQDLVVQLINRVNSQRLPKISAPASVLKPQQKTPESEMRSKTRYTLMNLFQISAQDQRLQISKMKHIGILM